MSARLAAGWAQVEAPVGIRRADDPLLGAACYLALWRHPVSTPLGQLGVPALGGPSLDGTPSLALIGMSLAYPNQEGRA
jgi:hypothetical protein